MNKIKNNHKEKIKKTPTNSEQLIISTANIIGKINVPSELKNVKQKLLERKEKLQNEIDRR